MQMLLKKESCSQTIKGSRFIAIAYPVSSHETAKELLEDIKSQHSKAIIIVLYGDWQTEKRE